MSVADPENPLVFSGRGGGGAGATFSDETLGRFLIYNKKIYIKKWVWDTLDQPLNIK